MYHILIFAIINILTGILLFHYRGYRCNRWILGGYYLSMILLPHILTYLHIPLYRGPAYLAVSLLSFSIIFGISQTRE